MTHTTDYNPETGTSTLRSVRGSLTIVNTDDSDWCETLHVVQVGTEVLAAYAGQGELDTAFDIIADYVVEHLPGYRYTEDFNSEVAAELDPHGDDKGYEVHERVMHENDYFTAGNRSDVFVSHEWYVIGSDCWSNRSKIEAVLGER